MPLAPGARLGPYEVTAPLGAGGMGEVYRARDTRLGREVALKVLAPALAGDPQYMSRFQREAQVLASLSHPHIATVYGLEESDGVRALVMELVEGPTLADRIAQGPLAIEEAVGIARQIAEALEAAHERGIVHRDLKPANVKLTREDAVKVLDFGLAKSLDDDLPTSSIANSPTITMAATRAGVILGTAAYMPPEQAKGKPVDRRADIWSFGVVLFEMLTGRQMYAGETAPETLASVMRDEPHWELLPKQTPAALVKLLRRCLDKDPKRRLRDIGEARIALEEKAPESGPVIAPAPPPTQAGWIYKIVAAAATVAALVLGIVHFRETPPSRRVLRYAMAPPLKSSVHSFALSPDGRSLAIAAMLDGKTQLWVRPLDALQAQLLPGTEEASYPFWSPDSRIIGFFAQAKLKKIAAAGGPVQTLCDAPRGRGGTWNSEDVIVFAPTNSGALQRVSAAGGIPAPATKAEGRAVDRFPVFLPDGRRFLFLTNLAGEKSGVYLASLDSPAASRVLLDQSNVAYVPPAAGSSKGHLLFVREGTLMAQPVVPKTMQLAGALFPVAEQVSAGLVVNNYGEFSASAEGTLVYLPGHSTMEFQRTWYDRTGKEIQKVGEPSQIADIALAPDEKTLAFTKSEAGNANQDIWLREFARGAETRFTFGPAVNFLPVWSPDGRYIAFTSNRKGQLDLYRKDTSGAGQDELLLASSYVKIATAWSSDGRFLLYTTSGSKTKADMWVLPMTGERKPAVYLETEFVESQGQFSPDGKWVAYTSDESGRFEIYVRPFPAAPGKWKISINGGQLPHWRADGRELFYVSPESKLMAAAVKGTPGAQPGFEAAAPQELFAVRLLSFTAGHIVTPYAVSRDGKRFLVNTKAGAADESTLNVVTNWMAAGK